MLEVLKDLGCIAEGEHGIEVSPAGQISRMMIKYRRRESLLATLINRCTFSSDHSSPALPALDVLDSFPAIICTCNKACSLALAPN